jgi:YfiH family protein
MKLILPDWIGAPQGVVAFSTERAEGVSLAPFDDGSGSGHAGLNLGENAGDVPDHVLQNRQRLRRRLPAEPAWLRQVHGATVVDAARVAAAAPPVAADASFTTVPGVVCVVTTADCLPVLLCDTAGRVVAAAHAGWRGLVGGVLQNTVAAMRAAGAGDLMAWMGPAIGPAHFEVGADVHAAFVAGDPRADAAFRPIPGEGAKYLADLYHLARLVLADSGVLRIAGGDHCTVREPQRFYSYRRDRQTGRMAALIWLK